jgi:tRNA(Ile2) C34 agmatinyltransferase TiaS
MNTENVRPEDLNWMCEKCAQRLVVGKVTVEYLGNQFVTDLPKCPECGRVYISEEVATGKMAEVEQLLEDK